MFAVSVVCVPFSSSNIRAFRASPRSTAWCYTVEVHCSARTKRQPASRRQEGKGTCGTKRFEQRIVDVDIDILRVLFSSRQRATLGQGDIILQYQPCRLCPPPRPTPPLPCGCFRVIITSLPAKHKHAPHRRRRRGYLGYRWDSGRRGTAPGTGGRRRRRRRQGRRGGAGLLRRLHGIAQGRVVGTPSHKACGK